MPAVSQAAQRGSIPLRATENWPSGGTGRHTVLRRPGPARGVGVRLSPWSLAAGVAGAQRTLIRSARPARYRGLQLSVRGWTSVRPGPMTLAGQVRLLDPQLAHGRVRKPAKRPGREPGDS